jgi:hypothetical protein
MATINDREIVDQIIAGNGVYPGDEAYPVIKIVKYQNGFDGKDAYGLIYKGEPLNKYAATPFVNNPVTVWEKDAVKRENGDPPTMEQIMSWIDDDGGCEATDGCWVEPDGRCEHGKPSWMLQMGLV